MTERLDALREAADLVAGHGRRGEYVVVVVRETATVTAAARRARVERVSTARGLRVATRVYTDGRLGVAVTSSLEPAALLRSLARARDLAGLGDRRRIPEDVATTGGAPVTGSQGLALGDGPEPASVADLTLALERAATGTSPEVGETRGASVGYGSALTVVRDSRGAAFDYRTEESQASCTAIARRAGSTAIHFSRRNALHLGHEDVADLGARVAEGAAGQLGAEPLRSTISGVILSPWALAVFLSRLASGFVDAPDAGCPARQWDWDADGAGTGRATLVDEGLLQGSPASRPADDEGTASGRTTLTSGGQFAGSMRDRATAVRAGAAPTGNAHTAASGYVTVAPTTLRLLAEDVPLAGQLRMVDRGCLVEGLGDFRNGIDARSGTISLAVSGRIVRGGELAEAFSDGVLACTAPALLGGVRAVDGDKYFIRSGSLCEVSYAYIQGVDIRGGEKVR